MLLDGLDEIADTPDEGVRRLLGLVNDLVATDQVKVCVSSRPEPALKRVLEKHPMLRMQDLTNRDIHLLTRERLEAMQIDFDNETAHDLSKIICEKAEGVFIWVILVLGSLQRGLANCDDMDTLYSRVESLPRDLTKLYKEMWSRMKEDSDLYRKKTVLLFYMAIEFNGSLCYPHAWGCENSLLGLVISTDDEMLDSFMVCHEMPDTELLWQKWHHLGRRLPAMSAGLLDITGSEEIFSSRNTYERKLKPWGKTGIHFTHRTAVDFICNSEEGNELFGAYVPNPDDILSRAIKTNIVLRRVTNRTHISTTTSPYNTYLTPKYDRTATFIQSFLPSRRLAKISSRQSINDVLSSSYKCLQIMGLNMKDWNSTSQSIKAHHAFLAKTFLYVDFVDWAEETLQTATAGVEEVTLVELLALRGACEGLIAFDWMDPLKSQLENSICRLSVIQRVVRKCSTTRQGLNDSIIRPFQLACSREISIAWRCLLIHTLGEVQTGEHTSLPLADEERLRWWPKVVKGIHCFLSTNVLEDLGQKYIVSIPLSMAKIEIISDEDTRKPTGEILFEVNDAAILLLIIENAEKGLFSVSLLKLLAEPVYRPKLCYRGFDPGDVFIEPEWYKFNEGLLEGTIHGKRLFTRALNWEIQDLYSLTFTSGGSFNLHLRKIGHYHGCTSALRAIVYELGTVNKDYKCFRKKFYRDEEQR